MKLLSVNLVGSVNQFLTASAVKRGVPVEDSVAVLPILVPDVFPQVLPEQELALTLAPLVIHIEHKISYFVVHCRMC